MGDKRLGSRASTADCIEEAIRKKLWRADEREFYGLSTPAGETRTLLSPRERLVAGHKSALIRVIRIRIRSLLRADD